MRKIIDGKRYDTETAELVGEWDNGFGAGDFGRVDESLYRKRSGEYFLHGEGGAQTRYAEQVERNAWSGGEAITPMRYDDARRWAEEHLDADAYEEAFGPVPEDAEGRVMSVRVSESTYRSIRDEAASSGRTMGAVVDAAFAR